MREEMQGYIFQSPLPYGSDRGSLLNSARTLISIPAPLRERPVIVEPGDIIIKFQSPLPYGSDSHVSIIICQRNISIPAPLRERPKPLIVDKVVTAISIPAPLRERPAEVQY